MVKLEDFSSPFCFKSDVFITCPLGVSYSTTRILVVTGLSCAWGSTTLGSQSFDGVQAPQPPGRRQTLLLLPSDSAKLPGNVPVR